MATETRAQFFALLEKGGIFNATELSELQQQNEAVTDVRLLARNLVSQGKLSEWQAKLVLSGRHKMKIGAYILQDRMPKQPIGDRFVALHRQLDRQVDVLIFPTSASENKGVFKQFLSKASGVAKLNHPNLLQLYDIDQDNGRYYLVFEHEEGNSLQSFARGSLNSQQIASIVKQCLDGISFAHQRDIMHGKIDESQIRVRGKKSDKALLRNMGLASLLDQLADSSTTSDEFAVASHPTDDIHSIGKIGQHLFTSHVGQALTDSDKQLCNLLSEIDQASDNTQATFQRFNSDLDGWLQRQQAELAVTQSSSNAIVDSTEPVTLTNTATPTRPASAKSAAKKSIANKNAKAASNKKASLAQGKKRLAIAVGAFIGICGIGMGVYYAVFSGDSSTQQAKSETTSESASPNASNKTNTSNKPVANKKNSASRNKKLDREKTGWRPPSDKAGTEDGKREAATETGVAKTVTQKPPVDPSETSSNVSDSGTRSTTDPQEEMTQETTPNPQPAAAVSFPGADGWPLISWENAKEHIGNEVVVYGVIQSVGGSGSIRFMNFKSRDNKSFTGIVRKTDWDISESKLRETYDDAKVLIKGKIELFKPKDQPQIILKSAEQIRLIDELPVSNGQPMVVSGTGQGSSMSGTGSTTTNGSGTAVVASGAFAKVPSTLGLIELTRTNPDYALKPLAEVDSGDGPLAVFLTVPEEASDKDVFFELVRDEQTRRRWEVSFAPRQKEADKKYVVGEFVMEGNSIGFRWKEGAAFNGSINQLRNCLLQLKTESESKTVLLRDPIELEPFQFDEKKPRIKKRLDVTNLPRPDSISIEFQRYPEDRFEEQVADMGTELNVDQSEIMFVFDKLLENQFFRVMHKSEIDKSIELESAIELSVGGQAQKYSTKNLRAQEQDLLKLQADTNAENTWALEYDPPKGSIRDHNKKKKEISARLELVNAQVAAYQTAKLKLAEVLAEKMGYRVLYTVGDIQFELAKTKQ